MSRGQVEIDGSVVRKRFSDSAFVREVAKARAVERSAEGQTFVVPRVLDVDPKTSTLTMSFIPEMTSSRVHYLRFMSGDDSSSLELQTIGKTLAQMHNNLRLEDTVAWRAGHNFRRGLDKIGAAGADEFLSQTPHAVLHGDYGFSNVNFVDSTDGLRAAVIDASPNMFSTFAANEVGSIYIDLAHITANLQGRVGPRSYLRTRWRLLNAAEELVWRGYEEEAQCTLDRTWLRRLGFADNYAFSFAYGNARRNILMHVLYNWLKGNKP